MMKRFALCLVAAAGLFASPAFAQSTYPTAAQGNPRVAGVVVLNCDTNGANCTPKAQADTAGDYVIEVPSAAAAAGVPVNRTAVAASSLVAKASAGNLYGYNVVSAATAGYVLIYNATTAPADGVVTPARCIPLAANTGIEVDLRGQPSYYTTGIVIAFSSTGCFTQALSATAFIAADVK